MERRHSVQLPQPADEHQDGAVNGDERDSKDEVCYELDDQYMFGENILFAPIEKFIAFVKEGSGVISAFDEI